MGLLYTMPISKEETDFVTIGDKGLDITVKSYGLPAIFWAYKLGIVGVMMMLFLAIKSPLETLFSNGEIIDIILVVSVYAVFIVCFLTLFSMFFYYKKIHRKNQMLTVSHHLFGIKIKQNSFQLNSENPFSVDHYLTSPNMARIGKNHQMSGFENKGYFELFAYDQSGTTLVIDRSNRKSDLHSLCQLLSGLLSDA
ncbi:MAG: hypothetical protein HOE90_15835 [Bacteriovoracaceae bacterium]|jgi:hypothetical protein|nr:hypothetical protein [Bacteriovoracaceae bacterium]